MPAGPATLALVAALAVPAGPPAVVLGVAELACEGEITTETCADLTAALVASLARRETYRVVRQSEVRKAEGRCNGDPTCLRATRERYQKLVSGTVRRATGGGGFEVRLRLLDAQRLAKEAESSAGAADARPERLRDAVDGAARSLLGS